MTPRTALRVTIPATVVIAALFAIVFIRAGRAGAQLDPTGRWNIDISGSITTSCTADFTLNGAAITAYWKCTTFGTGTLTGTRSKNGSNTTFDVSGTVTSTLGSANFTASGTVAQTATTMTGTWQATNFGYSGTFSGSRKEGTPTATATTTATSTDTPQPTDTPTPTACLLAQPGTNDCCPLIVPCPFRTSTPYPAATPTPAGVAGDANCDGFVDSIDAAVELQYIADLIHSLPCQGNADVNGDGVVNPLDVALTLQYIAGLLSHLPV